MARLFTEAELLAKLTGVVTALGAGSYDRAVDHAEAMILAYTKSRYTDTFPSGADSVRKQIGLELGYCHVMLERFQEERVYGSMTMVRKKDAVDQLKALAKGEIMSDAVSDEDSEQQITVVGLLDSNGDAKESAFSETVTNTW